MKNTFNFDLRAMVQPKNASDIAAMLKEALAEMKSVNAQLAAVHAACREQGAMV